MTPRALLPIVAGMAPVLLFALVGCVDSGAAGRLEPASSGASTVVRRGDLEDRFLLTGELRAIRSRQLLTPRTPTWTVTIEWLAPEGSEVRAGDPVVQFDSSAVLSNVDDRELAVTTAYQQLERTRVEQAGTRHQKALDLRRKEIARDRAALQAAIPAALQALRDYQDSQLALEQAEAALEKSERDLRAFDDGAAAQVKVLSLELQKSERALEEAESSLDELALKAPVDGVLMHGTHPWEGRKWVTGDAPWAGISVAELPDLSVMEVEAWLSDVDDGEVLAGMPVRCVLDAYPDRSFAGRVRQVAEVAEEPDRRSSRRFFRVLIELEEIDPEVMRPGMSVKAVVTRGHWEGVLLVPRASLDLEADEARLRLADGSRMPVTLEGCDWTECALRQGPPEGTALEVGP